jgi:hypothetical protein
VTGIRTKLPQAAGSAHQRGHRDLFGANASMFGVEPEAVVPPGQAEKLDGNRMDQPAGAKDADDTVGFQQAFEKSGHQQAFAVGVANSSEK